MGLTHMIYYNQIKDISNSDEKRRKEDWVALGIIGLFWKTKHIYSIIEYHDGVDNQVIVIDFENNVNYAQGLIYKKMLEFRKTTEVRKPDSDTSSHSPIRFDDTLDKSPRHCFVAICYLVTNCTGGGAYLPFSIA